MNQTVKVFICWRPRQQKWLVHSLVFFANDVDSLVGVSVNKEAA